MESLIFALNAVLPIILMVVVGYSIKKIGIVKVEHAKVLNKLVFRLFLPVMLFLNIYKIDNFYDVNYGYILYSVIAAVVIFFVSIPLIILVTKHNGRRGALLQATFRSNYALIGIPLAEALFGASGAAVATLLSAIIVPVFNVLSVISLSVFNSEKQKVSVKSVAFDIIKNPLIISIFIGVIGLLIKSAFVELNVNFHLYSITPLWKVLSYLSSVATPLALLVLGIQFEFSSVSELKREIIFGVIMRTVIVPLLGLGIAFLCFKDVFSGAHFATFVAVFATPVAVSSVPMAQEMGADFNLAGQLVVWSTVFSSISIFVASFLLSVAGVL